LKLANPELMMSNTSDSSLPVFTGNSKSGQYQVPGIVNLVAFLE
jgi:hypothetical protein